MPKNTKLKSILIIGSGPIVIGKPVNLIIQELKLYALLREDGIETS